MGGQGHAAVGDGDVEAGDAGEAADDGLAVGGHRAGADRAVHDAGVVEAADRALGADEELLGPAVKLGFGGVQVDGGVRGFQVQQAARVRAQGQVGGVHQAGWAGRGDRADSHRQPGCGGAADPPGDERDRSQFGGPAAGAADYFVRVQDGPGGGADSRYGARLQAGDPAVLAGSYIGAVALGLGDQAGDERFGQQVALAQEECPGDRDPQGRFQPGGFGRVDDAGGVAPLGQAADPGGEFGRPGGGGVRQLDMADGAVPGVAVEILGELGPGEDSAVVEVVVVPGRLVVGVDPGKAPLAGGAARLVLVQQGHLLAGRRQPGRYRSAQDAGSDDHATAGRHTGIISRGEEPWLTRGHRHPPAPAVSPTKAADRLAVSGARGLLQDRGHGVSMWVPRRHARSVTIAPQVPYIANLFG